MTSAFDPRFLVARYLHPQVCEQIHDFDEAECVFVASPVAEFIASLRAAGLGLVPVETMGWLERAFAELVHEETSPESATDAPWYFEEIHFSQVRIRQRMRDGSVTRSELMPHHEAVIVLGVLNHEHDESVVSAVIEDEAAWIKDLMGRLGPGQAAA